MEKLTKDTHEHLIKDCIFTALMMLMEQKDFDDITITEIAKKAGVSRMTYYRTYSSKEDILIQYFDEMTQNLITHLKDVPDLTPYNVYFEFFSFFKEHTYIVENLIKANLIRMVLEHFIQFVEYLFQNVLKMDTSDTKTQYRIHYHTGGLFTLTARWIQNGKKETPDEMAKLALEILEENWDLRDSPVII